PAAVARRARLRAPERRAWGWGPTRIKKRLRLSRGERVCARRSDARGGGAPRASRSACGCREESASARAGATRVGVGPHAHQEAPAAGARRARPRAAERRAWGWGPTRITK